MTKRCPFCVTFDRSDRDSEVQSLRELAVHIVLAHAEEFHELAETVSSEWDGRFATKADGPGPEEPEGWCYRYWGSDGTLCAQHHERFATPTATRCAALSRPLPENREEPSRPSSETSQD